MIYNCKKLGHNRPEETAYAETGSWVTYRDDNCYVWCAGGMGGGVEKWGDEFFVNGGRLLSKMFPTFS